MTERVISEAEFAERAFEWARCMAPSVAAVTGPGRSGAVASVYLSHMLGVPFLPFKAMGDIGESPILIVDTAIQSGRTLRKVVSWYERRNKNVISHAFYNEPPRVRFWYETRRLLGLREYEPLAEGLGGGLQNRLGAFESRTALTHVGGAQ